MKFAILLKLEYLLENEEQKASDTTGTLGEPEKRDLSVWKTILPSFDLWFDDWHSDLSAVDVWFCNQYRCETFADSCV